jgi:glycosyltransferase involved in cell wall biosynthesis
VRRDHIDLFYGPTDIVPLGLTCPSVCAFRNPNIYVPIPEMAAGDRMRLTALRGLAIGSAQRCRRAIFVSGAARDEIAPVLRLDPAKARVIHHGLGRVFRDALTGPRPWDRPYILTVSTQYEYKNTPRLIEAFARFVHGRGLPHGLVVVGALVERPTATRIQETIARLGLGDVVRLAGEVGYPAVGAWYSHASAFVFPSWRETFGHPLLEAMAADLPIAAADIPVMREIAADAARYFDPRSVDAMGEAILQALYDPNRAALIARGRERLSAFSWETSARRTLDVFSEAAG